MLVPRRTLCIQVTPQEVSPTVLLLAWLRESQWRYCQCMSSEVDRERYTECVNNTLRKFFSEFSLVSARKDPC